MDERKTTVSYEANGPNTSGASSDEIKRDIDRTRYEMDETLDELSERLQPRHLLDDVLDVFRSDTGGAGQARLVAQRAGRNFVDQIQENPVPMALIGAGIAWMLLSGRKEDRYYYSQYGGEPLPYPDDPRYDLYDAGIEYSYETSGPVVFAEGEPGYYASTSMPYSEGDFGSTERASESRTAAAKDAVVDKARAAGASVKGAASSAKNAASSAAHAAAERSRHAASSARQGLSRARGAVSGAASSTSHSARDAAHMARLRAEQMGRRARYRGRVMSNQMQRSAQQAQYKMQRGYRYSRDEFEHGLEEHPLGMGAAFFALGILAEAG
ncbi:MAG: DUF3618 domain-containing protein, partial [Candidatus Hydrogenedentales bacterium]